jgi:hypothetical protein
MSASKPVSARVEAFELAKLSDALADFRYLAPSAVVPVASATISVLAGRLAVNEPNYDKFFEEASEWLRT